MPDITALKRVVTSPRLYVYLACTVLAVLANYHLGKEMLWDTMDYHVYAGFSALHDRFGRDYFAAGPQGYFNPYVYVPFYLLLRSALTPLEDASILAVLQSAILWLTFELAFVVVPKDKPRTCLVVGILAALFAFANPVLLNELGSSYADITTAELVLAGWLLLVGVVGRPGAARVVCAALLLGGASALKLTNSVHAVSAAALLLFVPGGWRIKVRHAAVFVTGVAASLLVVTAPWSLRLERHFGNPLFPLLNGIFRSPQFTTGPIRDYRFIPTSLGAALLRPFTMVTSAPMVHFELPAPDLRYALLLLLFLLLLGQWAWRRLRGQRRDAVLPEQALGARALVALACGFLLDWVLWLTASGNSRYFIPMACVAAVLGVALAWRFFARMTRVWAYLPAAIIGMQCFTLYMGTDYRARLPWTEGPWFSLSVPPQFATQPSLYFLVGLQSNSFIIPDLPSGSGFVNLAGAYVLGPDGANGMHVAALIHRYAPRLRVVVRDSGAAAGHEATQPVPDGVNDVLEPFGLKAVAGRCSTIAAHGVTTSLGAGITSSTVRGRTAAPDYTEYLAVCEVDRSGLAAASPLPGQRAADLALDHLEDACPTLLQPRRPVDTFTGDPTDGYVFMRRYSNTNTLVWVARGSIKFKQLVGGREQDAGSEAVWESATPRFACGREGTGAP